MNGSQTTGFPASFFPTIDQSNPRRLWRAGLFAAAALVVLVSVGAALWAQTPGGQGDAGADAPPDARAPIRVGTYDSRAVAVAYVRSALSAQKMDDLMRQHSEAKAKGDARRIEELQAQGESMQVRRHLQGFSTAPIEDVLDTVRDRLPEVARRADVVVIARAADYHADSVELVDVTDALVGLFDPDDQTRRIIADLRKRQPLPIEDVARMPAKQ